MKSYDRVEPCPKCGSVRKKVEWVFAMADDYLGVECRTCGYRYRRAPLDRAPLSSVSKVKGD